MTTSTPRTTTGPTPAAGAATGADGRPRVHGPNGSAAPLTGSTGTAESPRGPGLHGSSARAASTAPGTARTTRTGAAAEGTAPAGASPRPGIAGSGSPRTAGSGSAGTGPGRGSARPGGTGPGAVRPGRRHDRRRPPTAVHRGGGPHHWFAERLLAVLSGRRPVHSLIGHTIGPAYDQLITLAPADPPHERPYERPYEARRLSPVLHGCGRFTPGPGVIEAFARIATGDRLTALAFRLEQGPDLRWRCAAVELQGPRP
ncbi:Rv3235 family protein [Streptomyces sp. NPDC002104]